MIGFYDYTVVLTYVGVVFGVNGILAAFRGNVTLAVICVMVSGLCDMFDGAVAKTKKDRTELGKKFGILLDSLADLICFGVAPASIGYALGMTGWYHVAILSLYVLAALIRLAYFTVTEDEMQKQSRGQSRKYYDGMPVTTMAFLLPVVFCICNALKYQGAWVYTLLFALAAAAFVSKFKFRKPTLRQLLLIATLGAVVFALVLLL